MGGSTGRDNSGSGPDQYWRRRAVALGSVLGVAGLLAYACSGASGDDSSGQKASAAPAAGSPVPPTVMPTVTVTATTTPKPKEGDDGGPCRDLVVSMEPSQTTYATNAQPEFRVTVVNMDGGSCTFDTGELDVRITSGDDRIWSSAECRHGKAEKKSIKRGVPYVETVTWNRKRGCKGANARPGTYVAVLKGKKAKKQVFHLR